MKAVKSFLIFFVIAMLFLPATAMAINLKKTEEVTTEIIIPTDELEKSQFFYNPDKYTNLTRNGTFYIPYVYQFYNKRKGGVGISITKENLRQYLYIQGLIPKSYVVHRIKSFDMDIQINITYFILDYVNIDTPDYIVLMYFGDEWIHDITPTTTIYCEENPASLTGEGIMYANKQELGWGGDIVTHNGSAIAGIVFSFKTGNQTSYEMWRSYARYWNNTTSYEVSNNFEVGATQLDMTDKIIFRMLVTEQEGVVEVNPAMNYTNISLYGNIVLHITAEVGKPIPVTGAFDRWIMPMIVVGIFFLILGVVRYNKELFNGFMVALGLALIITGIALYYIPAWQTTWLPILLPVTVLFVLLYLFAYTKVIDSTLHPDIEYWILKWGDALSIVLIVLTILEMWIGLFSYIAVPFWAEVI